MIDRKIYKIAVCISGEARTYKSCILNISKFFKNISFCDYEIVIDYFIHTWDQTTPKPQYNQDEQPEKEFSLDIPFIKNHINLIDYKIDISRNSISEMRNWRPMLYSMYYCNFLKQKYEIENHFSYNMVVKSRFDIIFNLKNNFSIHKMYEQTVYTISGSSRFSNELNCFNFDDVFFYGTSFTMDILSNAYNYVNNTLTIERFDEQVNNNKLDVLFAYGPGCLIYHFMTIYGFNYDRINLCFYAFYRYFKLPEDWNVLDDYDQIGAYMFKKYYKL